MSPDGRYLGLGGTVAMGAGEGFLVHDLKAGLTVRVQSTAGQVQRRVVSVSSGGLFSSYLEEIIQSGPKLTGIDTTTPGLDLSGDLDYDDTVLRVLDTREAGPPPLTHLTLGTAEQVDIASSCAGSTRRARRA